MILLVLALFAQVSPVVLDGDILSSNTVVINEFMSHPSSSCTELDGEWIELYNNSSEWVNLSGWSLENSSGQRIQLSTYLLPPEGFYVLGSCGNESLNGGFTPDFVYSAFTMNDYGRLTLLNDGKNVIDEIVYDNSWPIQAGSSCERVNPGWVSGQPSSWDYALQSYGNGDMGTPGSRNSVYENSFAQNSWAFIKAFVE